MAPPTMPATPWYVSAMVAVSAWVASLFLLAFLGASLGEIVRGPKGALIVGTIVCAICAVAMRTMRGRLFAEQFAVAASFAGQALVAYGILDAHWRAPSNWLALAVVEVALVAAAPTAVHRVLCTMAATLAVRFALAHAGASVLYPALVAGAFVAAWWFSHRGPRNDALWRPVTAGLALVGLLAVPVALADLFAWQVRAAPIGAAVLPWIAALALAAVLLALVAGLLRQTGVSLRSRTALVALAAAAAVALAARPVPGLVVALVVLLAAFGDGRRALAGVAIAGLVVAIVHHYYALDATLLAKSGALLATGIVLIAGGLCVRAGLAGGDPHDA
jgi:uncharacterized membrane protein